MSRRSLTRSRSHSDEGDDGDAGEGSCRTADVQCGVEDPPWRQREWRYARRRVLDREPVRDVAAVCDHRHDDSVREHRKGDNGGLCDDVVSYDVAKAVDDGGELNTNCDKSESTTPNWIRSTSLDSG